MSVGDLTRLIGGTGAEREAPPVTARGQVTRAPVSDQDTLEVILTEHLSPYAHQIPARNWEPMGGRLPAVDDACLVIFDDLGDAWVGMWSHEPGPMIATGTGAPSSSTGVDGQFYINLTTLQVWGPKAGGAWPGSPFAKLMPPDYVDVD